MCSVTGKAFGSEPTAWSSILDATFWSLQTVWVEAESFHVGALLTVIVFHRNCSASLAKEWCARVDI